MFIFHNLTYIIEDIFFALSDCYYSFFLRITHMITYMFLWLQIKLHKVSSWLCMIWCHKWDSRPSYRWFSRILLWKRKNWIELKNNLKNVVDFYGIILVKEWFQRLDKTCRWNTSRVPAYVLIRIALLTLSRS